MPIKLSVLPAARAAVLGLLLSLPLVAAETAPRWLKGNLHSTTRCGATATTTRR